jgi:hypothetical protein
MKDTIKATFIVFTASLVLFLILKIAGIGSADAAKLALAPFSAIGFVNGKLEERTKLLNNQPKLQTFSNFSMPFWKIFLFATLSANALIQLVAASAGIITSVSAGALATPTGVEVFRLITVAAIPLNFYILFAVGRWIGIRSEKRAFLTAALVGSLVRLIDSVGALTIMSPVEFKNVFGAAKTDIPVVAAQIAGGMAVFGGSCLLGAWRGRSHRQAWYLDHLLKSVAPESRAAIIDLTYEEARKTLAPVGQFKQTTAGSNP